MFNLPSSVKIYLAKEPTDMRRGFDRLSSMVQTFGHDVYSGHLFAFISKRKNRVKILCWEPNGFVLWYKRIEKGCLKLPSIPDNASSISLDAAQLTLLLEGYDLKTTRRKKIWRPPKKSTSGIDT